MDIQLKKGALDICVLHILNKQDSYGYDITEKIAKFIDIGEGSIYPILRKLKDDGCLTTYLKESVDGPPRKYYKITERGQAKYKMYLEDWNQFSNSINKFLEEK